MWIYKTIEYALDKNDGYHLDNPPTEEQRFFKAFITDLENGFHIDWVLAFVSVTFWLRMLVLFEKTSQFGPSMQIIYLMVNQLIIFICFWFAEMMTWASFGILIFEIASGEDITQFRPLSIKRQVCSNIRDS